jgi:hypothetical protein
MLADPTDTKTQLLVNDPASWDGGVVPDVPRHPVSVCSRVLRDVGERVVAIVMVKMVTAIACWPPPGALPVVNTQYVAPS